jgi:hypothetical protein
MSLNFEIPSEQVPEDPKDVLGMLNFLSEVYTGCDFSRTYCAWEEKGYSDEMIGRLIAFAQTTMDAIKADGNDTVVNLTEVYSHWGREIFEENPILTTEMIETFNDSFWNGSPERLVVVKNLAKKTLTIYGGIPPLNIEEQ